MILCRNDMFKGLNHFVFCISLLLALEYFWKAINTHRTDVTENPQIDDVILKIFVRSSKRIKFFTSLFTGW